MTLQDKWLKEGLKEGSIVETDNDGFGTILFVTKKGNFLIETKSGEEVLCPRSELTLAGTS